MADYDLASNVRPVLGTAAAAAMQGAVFTPAIDLVNFKSVMFVANISALTAYSAVSFDIEESDDGVAWANAAAGEVIFPKPKSLATTSRVFHASYIGKKRYVRAAFNDGAAATGQITAILGHPDDRPVFQDAIEV